MKKILIWSGSVLGILTLVLAIHIYLVTRPKAPDAFTRIMARIDIKKSINSKDAADITTWMYQQQGIDRVLCNPGSGILVYTYAPVKTNQERLFSSFRSHFSLPAERIIPTEAELQTGCPVKPSSVSYKIYAFLKKIG